MIKKSIQFHSIDTVKKFVAATNSCDFDVDLICGRYLIDAKSIMGIFSLDLDNPMTLQIHSDDCADFLNEIAPYIVNK